MSQPHKIPVIVLTGFLGSGKTTLLNRLLADGVKTAVIINEFGSTPIDQTLLNQTGMPLTVLAGGCLCCQIKGALAPTLKNLWMAWHNAAEKPFERMIIETSGVASPEPILDTLLRERWLSARYHLQQVIVTLASPHALEQLDRFAEARAQLAWADVLVITHDDLADTSQQLALSQYLQQSVPATPTFQVNNDHANLPALPHLAVPTIRRIPPGHPAPEHSFLSLSLYFDQTPAWPTLQSGLHALLERHPKELLRIKGVVYSEPAGEALAVHAAAGKLYPPTNIALRAGDDRRSRLVFITSANLDAVADDLVVIFGAYIDQHSLRRH